MGHEFLIVTSFGIALAVTSVYLFLAHVKRISAPNKADPAGTLVRIDLTAALLEDQVARQRKSTAKRCRESLRTDAPAIEHPSVIKPTSIFCEITSSSTSLPSAKAVADHSFVWQERRKTTTAISPSTSTCSTIMVPSPLWAEAFLKHAEAKRKELRDMVKRGEESAGWEAAWERLPPPRRRRVLVAVREELVHAVSHYIGQDENLFDAMCPELRTSALEEEHQAITGFSRLMRRCLDGKLLEPRSRVFATVQHALSEVASAGNFPKDKRGPVRAFLATFRKLCAYSFCIGVLEAVVSGRADGSAGPTMGSVCAALVKACGSGVLLWAFFNGLSQMSASNITGGDAAEGLAAGASVDGGSFLIEGKDL